MEYKQIKLDAPVYVEDEGVFEGYASIFGNVDSGDDIVERGAFSDFLQTGWERVKILFEHNDDDLPIGKPLDLHEDERGLFIKAKIVDTSKGTDVRKLLRANILNELSIGYDPIVFDYDEKGIRHLRKIKLHEVSVVKWAMNPEATVSQYKGNSVVNSNGLPSESKSNNTNMKGSKTTMAKKSELSMDDLKNLMKGAVKEALLENTQDANEPGNENATMKSKIVKALNMKFGAKEEGDEPSLPPEVIEEIAEEVATMLESDEPKSEQSDEEETEKNEEEDAFKHKHAIGGHSHKLAPCALPEKMDSF